MNSQAKKVISEDDIIIHRIIQRIEEEDLQHPQHFGALLDEIFLGPNHYAIFIDDLDNNIFLLKEMRESNGYWDNENNIIKFLFNLLNTLKFLEEKRFVYCVPPAYECDKLIYREAEDFYAIREGYKYRISETKTLERNEGKWAILQGNDILFRESFKFKDQTFALLNKYLLNYILPTNRLSEYIKLEYQTKNEYNAKKSIEIAEQGVLIAIAIGLVSLGISPLINTCMGNKYGETKLNKAQFDTIISKQDSIKIIRDTLILDRPDTVNCIIIENKTQPKKVNTKNTHK